MSDRRLPSGDDALSAFLQDLADRVSRIENGGAIAGEISLNSTVRIGDVNVVTGDGSIEFADARTGAVIRPAGSTVERVTELPVNPDDATMVEYTDATSGANWLLIYHADDGLWHAADCAPIRAAVDADEVNGAAVSGTYFAFASGPVLTIPLTGLYELSIFALVYGANGATTQIALALNGAAPAVTESAGEQTVSGSATVTDSICRVGMFRNLTAGETLELQQRASSNASGGHFLERVILARPVTVT